MKLPLLMALCGQLWKEYPLRTHASMKSMCRPAYESSLFKIFEEEGTKVSPRFIRDLKFSYLKSHKTYSMMGSLPKMNFIFLATPDEPESKILAQALPALVERSEPCPVFINPKATQESPGNFQQIIAHEIFHCFQARHFKLERGHWSNEASAEYMSSVAVPEGQMTVQHAIDYDPNLPLMSQSNKYAPAIFFNQMGLKRTLDFLDGKAALSEVSFHRFARNYDLSRITDPGDFSYTVKSIPLSGNIPLMESASVPLKTITGTAKKWKLHFLAPGSYELKRTAAGLASLNTGSWRLLPQTVEVGCDQRPVSRELLLTNLKEAVNEVTLNVRFSRKDCSENID